MLARRAMLPSPKLHPLAWRGTLTPDIISQPVSPRPRKKDGSRFTNPREREKIRIARPSAGSIFLSPTAEAQAGAGSIFLSPERTNALALDPWLVPHSAFTHKDNENQCKRPATLQVFTYKNNTNHYKYRTTPSVVTHKKL